MQMDMYCWRDYIDFLFLIKMTYNTYLTGLPKHVWICSITTIKFYEGKRNFFSWIAFSFHQTARWSGRSLIEQTWDVYLFGHAHNNEPMIKYGVQNLFAGVIVFFFSAL